MSTTTDPAAPATSPPRPARSGARTLAVTSGKGGVGKTFVTANLAAALADSAWGDLTDSSTQRFS